jgi:hypothetical protein
MSQEAYDVLRRIELELATVIEVLDARRLDPVCTGSDKAQINEARAHAEKTYLLRLLAEFEGSLTRLGPKLHDPVTFNSQDGLGTKLDQIGRRMGMRHSFRTDCDDQIRKHRNELAHGRSPVPRVSFDTTHQLMKQFLRQCW